MQKKMNELKEALKEKTPITQKEMGGGETRHSVSGDLFGRESDEKS
jgi:hypothetical protein